MKKKTLTIRRRKKKSLLEKRMDAYIKKHGLDKLL